MDTQNTQRKVEPLIVDQNAVNDLMEVTRKWAFQTQFEQDLKNYDKLKQQYE